MSCNQVENELKSYNDR